ncbi:hypothetical protein D3C81_826360 [compost metagenome]
MEFVLEASKPLEVVELFATPEHHRAQALRQRSAATRLQAGQRHHAQAEAGVVVALVMQDQADHHEFHGQLWRLGVGAHQVEAGQLVAMGLQQVGEGHRPPLEADQGNAKMLQVLGAETPQRKAFFTHILAAEPGVGNRLQLGQRRLSGFVDLQAQAVSPPAVPGVAQVFHLLALGIEVEATQVDPGFFAELECSQANVHIERQVLCPHLVEHRAGMVQVAQVAELPDHLGALLGGADRVVQRHQAAPATGIHKEGIAAGVKQQRLVAGQGQAAIRLVGRQ